jgi:hypothetical protein
MAEMAELYAVNDGRNDDDDDDDDDVDDAYGVEDCDESINADDNEVADTDNGAMLLSPLILSCFVGLSSARREVRAETRF